MLGVISQYLTSIVTYMFTFCVSLGYSTDVSNFALRTMDFVFSNDNPDFLINMDTTGAIQIIHVNFFEHFGLPWAPRVYLCYFFSTPPPYSYEYTVGTA